MCGLPAWGLGVGLTTPHRKKLACYGRSQEASAWHAAPMREKRNTYRILVGKSEGKRSLEKPRRRWVDNIKIDLREIG
jgi:hypothetical protein